MQLVRAMLASLVTSRAAAFVRPALRAGASTRPRAACRPAKFRFSAAAQAAQASEKPLLITTPIYYVNDKPHIGHAYTTLACDVLARWNRLKGREVFFLTGTDEHGQKVQEAAAKAGVDPQAYVDNLSESFSSLLGAMDFSNDEFVRTTSEEHKACVTELWRRLEANQQLYLGAYEGWYSVRDECYYTETELVDGRAPTGAEVEWCTKEESYFFKLGAFEQPLLDFYEANPDFIAPASRRNEVISFVKGGLRDLSVSRTTFNWGVPVPKPAAADADADADSPAHVMYVWVDALANYISALGWGSSDQAKFDKFWPSGSGGAQGGGEVVHMVGKDILRFHGVYWPALLMAAGLAPPDRLFAHGWWTRDGQKISKSVGNVIDPVDLVATFGVDQVRYFLMSEVPFGKDGDYSEQAMLACANGFLANALGNLLMRVLSLVNKNCGGEVPSPGLREAPELVTPQDQELLAAARGLAGAMEGHIKIQALHKAAGEVDAVVRLANKYIDEQAPWALKKTDEPRMRTVLLVLMESLRHVGVVLQPFMPGAAAKMLDQLAVPQDQRALNFLAQGPTDATYAASPGTAIPKPAGLFPRIDLEEAEEDSPAAEAAANTDASKDAKKKAKEDAKKKQGAKGGDQSGDQSGVALKGLAADVVRLDIRVGKIVKAWEHPESDKLWCEEIDLGESSGPRTICSGLRVHYADAADLEGRSVLVLANLQARKMAGVPSEGMVLCASSPSTETEDGAAAAAAAGGVVVKFLEPPPGSVPGDRVSFQGLPNSEPPAGKKKGGKVAEKVVFAGELTTSEDGACTFQGEAPMVVEGKGPVTAPVPPGYTIA